MMEEKIKQLKERFKKELALVKTMADLERHRVTFLGRKGELSRLRQSIEAGRPEERREIGRLVNTISKEWEDNFAAKKDEILKNEAGEIAEREWIDVTLPGQTAPEGHLHLTSQAIVEIEDIFARIGFTRVLAPDVDWDWYVFESLNIPPDHPARDNWETFFVKESKESRGSAVKEKGRLVLTPHTSNSQVRELEKGHLPIRVINIGRCYRRQSDVSHIPMFHQFEGFAVDVGLSVAHLKGVLEYFARSFFGPERQIRLRPHHFRFTEPSFEVDISCGVCQGNGRINNQTCRLCKSGWLELGGAGMTHPKVLLAGGVDPKKNSAIAFGWGVERTLMMREGLHMDDIRVLYGNDLRFLTQF